MSGSLIGGIVGAGIALALPGATAIYAMYGFSAGSMAGGLLFPQHVDGPRLTDLKPQASEYGRPIPIVYGTVALGGNVIWASDYIVEKGETGGKGGPTVDTESYYGNFAIAFAEGECNIGRMWAGPEKRLIWDGATLEGGGKVRFYTGSEDQLPDPLIESYLGVGNVSAFRGTCYVVFEHFPLLKDGNTLPFITAEVGATAKGCPVPVLQSSGKYLSDPAPNLIVSQPGANQIFYDALTGKTYWTRHAASGQWFLNRIDLATGASGPEILIASGGNVRIAWDNNGTAQYIVQEENKYTIVDLKAWQIVTGIDTSITHKYIERDGAVTEMAIALWDIAYKGGGDFGYLSENNTVNTLGHASGTFGIYPVPSAYTWGATGTRFYGSLTPMGESGAAASFITQPSNFSPTNTQWDVYIGGVHNILMSFSDAAYSEIGGGYTKMTTSFESLAGAVYDEVTDRVYVWQAGVGLIAYDPSKLTPESWPREPCVYYQSTLAQLYADGTTPINIGTYASLAMLPGGEVAVTTWPGGDVFRVSVSGRAVAVGASLAYVVADLSARAGLTAGQIDVSALTDIVDGYSIARQTTVRNAVDALRPAYYFDMVERAGKVVGVKRGGAPVATIDADDLDARHDGEASGDPLLTTRQMEVELPRVVNVNYLLAATDYSPATKLAKRLVGASGNEVTLDLPLVLTDTKAQEIADVNLQVAWVQRLTYAFNLPRKYSHLEPTDHIVVKGNGMRLTKVTRTPAGVIKCEATADGSTYYTPNTTTVETQPMPGTVYVPGTTSLELM